MKKLTEIDKKILRKLVFDINNHESVDGSGTPNERYFLRGIRSGLPNSFKKNLKAEDLMKIRASKQMKAALKKGKMSSDSFEVGDSIRVQDMRSKKWNRSGVIKEARVSDDGQEVSFIIEMENGRETIRHRSHLRHNVKSSEKVEETKVKFKVQTNDDKSDDKKDSDSSDRAESTSESDKPAESGVVTRSRARQRFSPPSSSALPAKSCLKTKSSE